MTTIDDTAELWDAIIIGGSIAGLSAAQMLGRARRRTLVIDAGEPRNRFASHMHGVLGLDGTPPADVLARGRAEAEQYGVRTIAGTVADVADVADAVQITLADGTAHRARGLIVATGIRDRLPDVTGLADLWGRSVLHCPYCHGWEVRDQRLAVIATSPASIHQVEMVRQWSPQVTAYTALAGPLAPDVRARLLARDIEVVDVPAKAVTVTGDILTGVTDETGTTRPADAIFVAPDPEIDLSFLSALALARTDAPGRPLQVDALGATSHPRVWAAGNVVAPYGNVPVSMGTGSMAGAAVNADLVAQDAAAAVDERRRARNDGWEQRYASGDRMWSGKANATLVAVVDALAPGRVLDVGCGEGGDSLWLAEHGWQVTAIDVSPSAVAQVTSHAAERGLTDRVHAEVVDLLAEDEQARAQRGTFDLVTASFVHSWEPDFPRAELLRRAAERVAPGGSLLVLSHAAPPPWSHTGDGHTRPHLLTPDEDARLLDLDLDEWMPERIDIVPRAVTAPDGSPATLQDGVLLYRRRSNGAATVTRL